MSDASIRKIRTLIVDDEPPARRNIAVLLQRDPEIEIVAECGSGNEALNAIRQLAPDLVFLDVQMPEHDGFDVVEMLGNQLQRLVDELACARHAFDLLLGLADDHARACTCSSTPEISAHTSSIGRSACTWTSLPLVR